MRAKEKLEFNRKECDYYEHVKKSINELYPLRTDKRQTKDYICKYHYADARFLKMIKNNNVTHEAVNFCEYDGEIDHRIAYRVRKEMQNAICDDETFIYAYNFIELDQDPCDEIHNGNNLNLKPETLATSRMIENEIVKYKEDYPKTNLADFLLDPDNLALYNQNKYVLLKDDDCWLFAFNKAYEIFDRVRVLFNDPFKAQYKKITLVMDNLGTHTPGALYERFNPAEAKRIWDRFEFVNTPKLKHGSWLNMAEIELNVLNNQCLGRRIPTIEKVRKESQAWELARNGFNKKINWQFTTEDARIKLKRLYPSYDC